MTEQLWKTSGHYDNFKENMFFTKIEEGTHCIRPMNCPSAILVFNTKRRSYRELPLRLMEYGLVHRAELSGVLHGLARIRAFTIDDAHIFCTPDQIQDEVLAVLNLAKTVYNRFEFENVKIELSTKPEKAIGNDEQWELATEALKSALEKHGEPFTIQEGEGAFYGPKIDLVITDALDREWQCGTVQVDFFLPQNFNVTYIDSDQSRKQPVLIHRALFGSVERFMGILLEHCKGKLPFWLAPVQARVLTITEEQREYAEDVRNQLREDGLRVELDAGADQIGAKIKRAQLERVPWMVVIGGKEVEAGTVTLRGLDGKQQFGLTVGKLVAMAREASIE